MSADPTREEESAGEPSADASGVIPVEVEPPDANGSAPESTAPDPIALLETKIAQLEKEKKDNYDRYLRAAADLENTRKRTKREIEDAKSDAKNRVLKEMLPVVDNLERAIEHAGGGGELDPVLKPIVEGVQLVLRQFVTAFERLDITPVDAANQPFDPNLHEAISQVESDVAPGTVIQVLQRGYKIGDRLLRPALVVVAKAKAAAE